jgi:hypothetical protein
LIVCEIAWYWEKPSRMVAIVGLKHHLWIEFLLTTVREGVFIIFTQPPLIARDRHN